MNNNQLYYFIVLAELEHYTKASKKLGITQPTLSNTISYLEENLGTKLFEKSGRNVILTKYGKMFLESAKESIRILEKGIEEIKVASSELNGQITLGHIYIQSNELVPQYIKGYVEKHSDLIPQFNLSHEISEFIVEGIKSDKYDIGICYKNDEEIDIEFLPLWEDELLAIVPQGHPLAEKTVVKMEELVKYPQILYSKSSYLYNTVEACYGSIKNKPNPVCTVDEAGDMVGLVAYNIGVGIVPKTTSYLNHNVLAIPIANTTTTNLVYLAYAKNKYQVAPVKRFIAYMNIYHKMDKNRINGWR